MLRRIFTFILLSTSLIAFSQVGIGTSTPNTSSILDIKSSTAGVLISRVALTNTTTFTLAGSNTVALQYNANSILVYNTATQNDVTEGYYYWKQTNATTAGKWIKLMNGQENVVAAVNGLNVNSSQNVALGGSLTSATTITASTTNTLAIAGLSTGTPVTDKIVVSSDNGVLKTVTSALPKVFYMPSITIDVSTLGTGRTLDLFSLYESQYKTPKVASTGAPATIPSYTKDQLYYYVTYFDPAVFNVTGMSADGVMTYSVVGSATSASYMNIVFVVK
jgi:hypothetical protein